MVIYCPAHDGNYFPNSFYSLDTRYSSMKTARFIGAGIFVEMVKNFRVLWVRGRYGGGKTSLTVLLSGKLLAEGIVNQVVSNIPMTFSVPASDPLKDACLVLDEAWMYIEGRNDVKDYGAFIRKQNDILLLPSVFPVHARFSSFYVTRIFNGYIVGLPVWWYRWTLRDKDIKETGVFGVLHPVAVFGHYPTKYVPGDDGGISEAMERTSKNDGYKGTRSEQRRTVSLWGDEEENKNPGEIFQDEITALDDVAQQFDGTAEDIEKIVRDIKRKIR